MGSEMCIRDRKRYTSLNKINSVHELQKKNPRAKQGLEGIDSRRSTADPLRLRCATLIKKKSTMIQASGPEHAGPGESESYPTSDKMSAK